MRTPRTPDIRALRAICAAVARSPRYLGYRKVVALCWGSGTPVSERQTRRLMRQHGISRKVT